METSCLALSDGFRAHVRRDPVDLPGLAAVGREGLLEPARVGSDVRDHEPHEGGPSADRLLVVELASSVPELADRGRPEPSAGAARDVQAPLPRLRVVEPKTEE